MKVQYFKINIGLAIEQRINELGISKSEFGRRIGLASQNVKKFLERESIDSSKLVEVCQALDYDFFSLYVGKTCEGNTSLLNVNRLKTIILDKGLSNISFASSIGLSRNELDAVLTGSDMSLGLVEKMAEVLGVKPAELINGASVTAEAVAKGDQAMYEELIALRAENKVLREIQGLSARSQVHVG